MKRLTWVLLVGMFSSVLCLNAENLSKHLQVKTTPDGTVVFIKPQTMKKSQNSTALKDMEYDIVLTSFSDSIMMTATLITSEPLKLDSIEIIDGNYVVDKYPIEKIYVEPSNKNWVSRVRFYMPEQSFNNLSNYVYPLSFKWGLDTYSPIYKHDSNKWNKFNRIGKLAIEIINQNKDK